MPRVWIKAVLPIVLLWAWPLARLEAQPPVLAVYPCQSGIAQEFFEGAAPHLSSGALPAYWSLFDAPPGMRIDPWTGQITWSEPAEGFYRLTLCATNAEGQDYAEWLLRVVGNDSISPRMYSTRYVDFVAPAEYIDAMQAWHVKAYVDACWERMRDVIGLEPLEGKQVFRYRPAGSLVAHMGNPAEAAPDAWSSAPVLIWSLGTWFHGVGHNFNARTKISRVTAGNWADRFFDQGVELTNIAVETRAIENPAAFGLSGTALANFTQWVQSRSVDAQYRCQAYSVWLSQGGTAETYYADPYGAWAWICRLLLAQYGPQMLEDTMRAFRVDGLADTIYDSADSDLRKNTLLFCVMSAAAGQDLRSFFRSWGWSVDDAFFTQVWPAVLQTVQTLPRTEDGRGWKHCPLNGHYYRLTPWSMEWYEAERTAERLGGHLVTLRSQQEEQWVVSRLGFDANLWGGLNDLEAEGVWTWISGEPFTYARWGSGEPNGGIYENAMLFNSWWGDYQWWISTDATDRFLGVIEATTIPGLARADWDRDGDVDGDDLVSFSLCVTGPAIPLMQGCENIDLDGDGDVDQADFGILQHCFSGSDVPANPACAD